MWVSGIMQGLMWREYDDQGFLVYSFAETVAAMYPYYVIRMTGWGPLSHRRAHHGLQSHPHGEGRQRSESAVGTRLAT